MDPLAEKYVHNSTYAFAENKVITFRELEGLEGVHYMEGNGHVVEKNVMVMLRPQKEIPKGADAKTVKKIERQNARIGRENAAKLASVSSELNAYFNGADGKGTKNSKGENVVFKFNVTGANDSGKEAKKMPLTDRNAYYKALGVSNGLFGTSRIDPQKATLIAPAAVLTTESSTKGDFGDTTGAIVIRMSSRSPEGGISHEVLHTLGLPDNGYNKGGLLNSPPQSISSSEVDEALRLSYEKE